MEVRGFKTAAVAAGIKASAVLDLALIYSETPATAAAVFTQNTFIAPPLIVSKPYKMPFPPAKNTRGRPFTSAMAGEAHVA